jgi:hypothetical protein
MSSTYSNLKYEIIEVGGSSGVWGGITNTNIGTAIEQSIVGMATLASGDFISNTATLPYTNTNAAQNFRAFCLNITATLTGAGTVEVPAIQKPYLVLNNSSGGFAVTVKVSGLTGVSIPNGKGCLVYNNGTDVGAAITHLTSLTLATPLPVTSGGSGTSTPSLVQGSNITITGSWPNQTINSTSQTYPGAGIPNSTGSAWGTSYSTTGSGTVVALATSPTFVTPALGTPTSGNLANCTVPVLTTTNFTISEVGGKLVFKYGATTIASMDSSGNLTTIANVTAYGTP